jgi:hypothetical protein
MPCRRNWKGLGGGKDRELREIRGNGARRNRYCSPPAGPALIRMSENKHEHR